jgi:hypothetical protein
MLAAGGLGGLGDITSTSTSTSTSKGKGGSDDHLYIYSSAVECMPVRFEVGSVCQGFPVLSPVAPTNSDDGTYAKRPCKKITWCESAYSRYELALEKGLRILSPAVFNAVMYGGKNAFGL